MVLVVILGAIKALCTLSQVQNNEVRLYKGLLKTNTPMSTLYVLLLIQLLHARVNLINPLLQMLF
jgi:hypothetical protein